jgi:putative MATE family efflux protein
LGTLPEIFDNALLYTYIILAGVPAVSVYNFGAVIFRGAGDSKTPFAILALSGLLNVGFNILFVAGFGMNVEGVAIATIIAQYASAIVVVILAMRLKDERKFSLSKLRIDGNLLKRMLLIGVPSAVQGSLFAISNMILQSSINDLGNHVSPALVSGNTIGTTMEGYTYVLTNSFYHSTVTFVGMYYGARDEKNAKRTMAYSLIQCAIVGISVAWLIILFSEPLSQIFIDANASNRAEVIKYAMERIFITQCLYFTVGVMEVGTGYLRALGRSIAPMIIAIFSVCVLRVFWAFVIFPIPQFYSITGLYICYPISWIIASIFNFILIAIVNKKVFPKIKKEEIDQKVA